MKMPFLLDLLLKTEMETKLTLIKMEVFGIMVAVSIVKIQIQQLFILL